MAQSLFILMILLSPLQMCSRKNKKKKSLNTADLETKGSKTKTEATLKTGLKIADTKKTNSKKLSKKKAKANITLKTSQNKKEQKIDDQTQIEGSDESDQEKADIIPIKKVKNLGNIDEVRKQKKIAMEKEVEEIKSIHEMDNQKPLNAVIDSNLHVKIKENKCKLYETNDEPTYDDENEEPEI